MSFVNFIPASQKKQIFERISNYQQKVFSHPRQVDPVFNFDKNFKQKQQKYEGWKVENSIFRDFKADSPILLKDCFEFDFENSRIKKYIKAEELTVVKEMLFSIYEQIINVFKF